MDRRNKESSMPQSSKDSKGGKTHATKTKSRSSGAVSEKAVARKSARSTGSPTGPNKHGEKKSVPH
jgi:hypothetical protein